MRIWNVPTTLRAVKYALTTKKNQSYRCMSFRVGCSCAPGQCRDANPYVGVLGYVLTNASAPWNMMFVALSRFFCEIVSFFLP